MSKTFDSSRVSATGLAGTVPIRSTFSVRDIASQTELKVRQSGQGTVDEVKRKDLRAELEAKERDAREKRTRTEAGLDNVFQIEAAHPAKTLRLVDPAIAQLDADDEDLLASDDEGSKASKSNGKGKGRQEARFGRRDDADDADDGEDSDKDDDESDESDDEDDTEELLRELEKIKRERAEEQARKEMERQEEEEKIRARTSASSSSSSGDFTVKKRWDDDVVFKNCAKDTPQVEKRFINDSLRSDFHRKFMDKYIK